MTEQLDRFGHDYVSALDTYLRVRDEVALNQAYELGRQAMVKGLGVLDMANLHQAAVGILVVSATPADQLRLTQMATTFFTELLSPFEMSFRGYRAANLELQRLNETLRLQKEAVENANRELESFSYSVSHDLRAPLRSITAFSQILIEDLGAALGDDTAQHLHRILHSAQHMSKLIDNLLSFARVTRLEIKRVDVNLTALARQIGDWLRSSSPDRDVAFIVEDDIHGDGDATLLTAVLENLLGNAWKFTSKRPHAEIRFGREKLDGQATYYIRDNGAGFDMTSARNLFAPFQRLHTAAEFEGTGIGLATVQRIVQRHDGDVWAEGVVGDGATFYFTLGGGRHR